jgi:hypothetical protein
MKRDVGKIEKMIIRLLNNINFSSFTRRCFYCTSSSDNIKKILLSLINSQNAPPILLIIYLIPN